MKAIVIGYISDYICYLDIDMEEAIEKYCFQNKYSLEEFEKSVKIGWIRIKELELKDKFSCYDIWVD